MKAVGKPLASTIGVVFDHVIPSVARVDEVG